MALFLCTKVEEGRGKREEGRWKKEEGRRKNMFESLTFSDFAYYIVEKARKCVTLQKKLKIWQTKLIIRNEI